MTEHRQRLATYIELFSALPVPISIASLERGGQIHFVNRALTDAFGYTLDDLPDLNQFAQRSLPNRAAREDALAWWTQTLTKAKYEGTPASPREFQLIDRSGIRRQIVVHPTVIHGLVISAYEDKTAQRDTERALLSAEQQLREEAYALTENIPIGTYTMVLEPGAEMARFRFMSTRFLELTGLERAAAEADPLQAFACVHPDDYDDWVALNAKTFAERTPFYGETRVVVDGHERWISAQSVPRELDDGTVVWEGVLSDLSRQKAAEAALRSVHQELLHSSVRQSRLNEREALLQDMHDGFGSQLVMARRYLDQDQLSHGELKNLLDQCLADMHLLADTLQINDPNLKQALANYRHRIGQRLSASDIKLRWTIELHHTPNFSSRQLVQVMRILQEGLNNALRHAQARCIDIVVRADQPEQLLMEVRDDGIGLSGAAQAGRGLSNMRQRAEELGGSLSLIDTSHGACLRLEWPSAAS